MKNDTKIIQDTINNISTKLVNLKNIKNIEYGQDSTGLDSVWISFLISAKKNKKLVENINDFSDKLTDSLFKNGLNSWPYIQFHLKK